MIKMAVSIRYIVDDVGESLRFYTKHLGFELEQDAKPAFASVTRGDLRLLLSGPGSSGARPMPDGVRPTPGGWNRILLVVSDLNQEVDRLRNAGVQFRNEVLSGVGGSQILLKDPSGNFIELFQPARHS
jgi:predicted enzyme related to lactoylglutathione lyase